MLASDEQFFLFFFFFFFYFESILSETRRLISILYISVQTAGYFSFRAMRFETLMRETREDNRIVREEKNLK